MTDTYRLPDNPLARALEQARADLARQRAEQDERARANAAAIEDLRAMLAALDPPLAVALRADPPSYKGDTPPEWVFVFAPTASEGRRVCRLWSAGSDIEREVRSPMFAEQVERLLAAERRAIAEQAQRALEPPPEIAPATRPAAALVSPEALSGRSSGAPWGGAASSSWRCASSALARSRCRLRRRAGSWARCSARTRPARVA